MKYFHISIASGLGSGFAPFAPGTWGTAVGTLILFALWWFLGLADTGWSLLILTIATSLLGYWSITELPNSWIHDDGRIVIDEVVGLWTSLLFITLSAKSLILSFILFRLFDIWKPLGIRKFDDATSDMSVIVDDLIAGVYANLTLRGLIILLSAYDLW